MRILRLKEIIEKTGLARSTIYKHMEEGIFPKPVPLGGRSVGWLDHEVHNWLLARIEERDSTGSNPVTPHHSASKCTYPQRDIL